MFRNAAIDSGEVTIWVLAVSKTTIWVEQQHFIGRVRSASFIAIWLCSHCRHQRPNSQDIDDAGQIVGQHMQRHLGGYLR